MRPVWIAAAVAGAAVLAGCGAHAKRGTVTVGAYGSFPATTVSESASPAECVKDGRIIARDGRSFLRHFGASAAYPADLYYMIVREDFADFEARSCDPKLLGAALRARLSAAQRASLATDLPAAMAALIRRGLAATQP